MGSITLTIMICSIEEVAIQMNGFTCLCPFYTCFRRIRLYVFLTLHTPSIIMNAFLLSCVFSVENKMLGGYWSRTGTADLSGALLHQKKWNCAVQ